MPYIKQEHREKWNDVSISTPSTSGELNYLITKLCIAFAGDEPNYAKFNEVIGALECCKLEMYRRAIAPYEDKKIKENGDVY